MTDLAGAPTSRNSPCPCGSGRRYKDCHGSIGATTAAADPAGEHHSAALAAALAAQKAGDLAAAAAGYRAVLAASPDHFDALHMLGVAMLQELRLDEALSLIARAASLRPGDTSVLSNLAIARRLKAGVGEEVSICRAVLPRLARLCVNPPPLPLSDVRPGDHVHVVFAGIESDFELSLRIARAAAARRADVATSSVADLAPPGWPFSDDAWGLADATVVIVGLDAALGEWPLTAPPRSTMLVATRDTPCLLFDRIREASGEGRRAVALATQSGLVAAAAALPMRVFAALEDT
jgi:SEC-C motif-containing protein/tetratricopeptide repeat protein